MNKLKKIIIIILVFIVLILTIVFILKKSEGPKDSGKNAVITINPNIQIETDRNKFYLVNNCVQKYLDYIVSANKEALYQLLDTTYIQKNNVTQENIVVSKVDRLDDTKIMNSKTIYKIDNLSYNTYFVYGKVKEYNNKILQYNYNDFYVIVNIDYSKGTFSVRPSNKEEYENAKKNIIDETCKQTKEIAINKYNKATYLNIEDKTLIYKYINDYKDNILSNIEDAYNSLNKEYREKRFGTLENYKKYVEENKELIQNTIIKEYLINKLKDGTEYVCKDNFGNYYIFKETSVMQYSLMLDTYTIPREEFIEKYNKGNVSTRVGINIEKFIEMLNNKDYKAAYGVLADGFKQNYFRDLNSFENYIKTNFYNYNTVEYTNFSNEGETYMYTVKLTDTTKSNPNTIEKTFVMQLKEGTDFAISFNVK